MAAQIDWQDTKWQPTGPEMQYEIVFPSLNSEMKKGKEKKRF